MKALKNRKIAVLITVIVAILATMFGVGRSLNKLARDVEATFYSGFTLENGQPQNGINHHLEILVQSALDCAALLAGNSELSGEAESLLSARSGLLDSKSISEKYSAYQTLYSMSATLIDKALLMELSEREKAAVSQFSNDFKGTTAAIFSNQYNIKALNFMDDASIFAHLLRPFVFVTPPETFDR